MKLKPGQRPVAGSLALQLGMNTKVTFTLSKRTTETKRRYYFIQYAATSYTKDGKTTMEKDRHVDGPDNSDRKYPNRYRHQTIGDYVTELGDNPSVGHKISQRYLDVTANADGSVTLTPKQPPMAALVTLQTYKDNLAKQPKYSVRIEDHLIDCDTGTTVGVLSWGFDITSKAEAAQVDPITPNWTVNAGPMAPEP
jgi:hypothetical protein